MEKLNSELRAFISALYEAEKKVIVSGEGPLKPRVMLIGEAPGKQETLMRRPFVGKAGKNLDEFLALSGLARSELYITNAVKFRPTRKSAAGNLINRPPTAEEIKLFLPYLIREIETISPECIVTLGNVPLRALMGNKVVVGGVHGEFLSFEGTPLFPMYHPASMIYNPSLRETYALDLSKLSAWLRR